MAPFKVFDWWPHILSMAYTDSEGGSHSLDVVKEGERWPCLKKSFVKADKTIDVMVSIKNAENEFREESMGKYRLKVKKDGYDGEFAKDLELHIGLDAFGIVRLDKCLLINKFMETKKIPVKKDTKTPKTEVKKEEKNEAEVKPNEEKKEDQNKAEEGDKMEDVNQQNGTAETTNTMADAPQDKPKEEVPVQEYEEVTKQKKREIECVVNFTSAEGR